MNRYYCKTVSLFRRSDGKAEVRAGIANFLSQDPELCAVLLPDKATAASNSKDEDEAICEIATLFLYRRLATKVPIWETGQPLLEGEALGEKRGRFTPTYQLVRTQFDFVGALNDLGGILITSRKSCDNNCSTHCDVSLAETIRIFELAAQIDSRTVLLGNLARIATFQVY
jgi:hypothetical protein